MDATALQTVTRARLIASSPSSLAHRHRASCHDLLWTATSAVAPGIAVVAGTLLGSSLTYLFQRRSAVAAQTLAFGQQLRAERLAAYSGLVTALAEFKHAEILLYHAELDDPGGTAVGARRAEEFRTRSAGLISVAQAQMRLTILASWMRLSLHGTRPSPSGRGARGNLAAARIRQMFGEGECSQGGPQRVRGAVGSLRGWAWSDETVC
jgi:hypothetical protein